MNETQAFYDGFADSYRFIFMDWQATVHRQAEIIGALLESLGEDAPKRILDCTCGIGTQAIALATRGYRVHGSDLSPKSIERAREYAATFELEHSISFSVADLLDVPSNPTEYDIVLAFDNPIAHLHRDADLLTAFKNMAMQLKAGGLLATSLRDYDAIVREKPRQSHLRVSDEENGRRIMFQVWDWHEDSRGYDSEMFVISENAVGWHTESHKATFRAWQREDVTRILAEAGLSEITWHMPEQSGFYQPIVTARK